MNELFRSPLATLPNALSALRLVLAPVMLGLAFTGRETAFLVTLTDSTLLRDRRFRNPFRH